MGGVCSCRGEGENDLLSHKSPGTKEPLTFSSPVSPLAIEETEAKKEVVAYPSE